MDNNTIRLSKVTLVIGIIDIVFFTAITILAYLTGAGAVAMIFPLFMTLGVMLIISYRKIKLVMKAGELELFYLIKKPKTIKYQDIHCILILNMNNRARTVIVDQNYGKIASLDSMMNDVQLFYKTMTRNGIPVLDFAEMIEEKSTVEKYYHLLNVFERNYYSTMVSEIKTIEKIEYDEKNFDVDRTKRIVKYADGLFILLNIVALLFHLGLKLFYFIVVFSILGTYLLYIKCYPYGYMETVSKKGKKKSLQINALGASFALIMSVLFMDRYQMDYGAFFVMVVCEVLVLMLIFLKKDASANKKQPKQRKVAVFLTIIAIAFSITIPLNVLLTFDEPMQEYSVVIDKNYEGGKFRHYYLKVITLDGKEKLYGVSHKEYTKAENGDIRRICTRKSVFGLEYSRLD